MKNTSNPETLQGPPRSIERRHFERPYAPTCGWIGQRVGTPEEVANMVLYLASDEAAWVTGGTFTIDGGMTVSKG